MTSVAIKRLSHGEGIPLPLYATAESAGADVCAAIESSFLLEPGKRTLIPTGFCYAIPSGYEIQVRPRSGLCLKHGITVLNTPGTIDADYRGELKVILYNAGEESFLIERSMRIAQIIVAPVSRANFFETSTLEESDRDNNGFGSTGLK